MARLLWLLHTGSVTCSDRTQAEAVSQGLDQLGIQLTLDWSQTGGQGSDAGGVEDPVKLQVEMVREKTASVSLAVSDSLCQ